MFDAGHICMFLLARFDPWDERYLAALSSHIREKYTWVKITKQLRIERDMAESVEEITCNLGPGAMLCYAGLLT